MISAEGRQRLPSGVRRLFQRRRSQQWITGMRSGITQKNSVKNMFSQKALYGDMDAFVKQLEAEGISEIHYIGNLEKKLDAIPGYVTTPWMISGMGIIYGKK